MKILFVAPAGLYRDGVARLLRDFAKDAEVLSSDDLLMLRHNGYVPECVVVDERSLNHDAAVFGALRDCARTAPVVVLVDIPTPPLVHRLLAAGVCGCVEKSATVDWLFDALRIALAGGVCLPRPMLLNASAETLASADGALSADASAPGFAPRLTPRQIDVLALVSRGRSNKMIARQLDMAEATVKTHLTAIFKTLNVTSRGEAGVAAARFAAVRDSRAGRSDTARMPVGRLFARVDSQRFRPGEVLFRKGDPGNALFYVERGTVRLAELGIELGAGAVLGEIGLFSPEHRRTSTAVCKTACEMRTVSADEAMRLYYQEPEFAMYLIQLLASRLQADKSRHA